MGDIILMLFDNVDINGKDENANNRNIMFSLAFFSIYKNILVSNPVEKSITITRWS